MDLLGTSIFWVLVVTAVGVGVCLVYLSCLAAKKRREELRALAERLGWQFCPDDDPGHEDECSQFEIFSRGHSQAAYNTLTGPLEIAKGSWRARAGDFRYKVTHGTGKHRRTTTYNFSYLIVHMPYATADLHIRQEGLFDKIAGALGFDDIDFESEEFSRRFHVKSPDKRFAYDVCHPRMIEFLLEANPVPIAIESGRMCLSDGSGRWDVPEFQDKIRFARQFFELWPEHLTRRLEGG